MKKMWKKNNKAVSPVIATILMVAITVVLAAVLYVMVMGFGGDGGGQAPTASLTNSGNRLVLSINEAYDIEEGMALTIGVGGADGVDLGGLDADDIVGNTYNVTGAVQFVDAGGDGKISTGDYFTGVGDISIIWSSGGTNQVIAEGTI